MEIRYFRQKFGILDRNQSYDFRQKPIIWFTGTVEWHTAQNRLLHRLPAVHHEGRTKLTPCSLLSDVPHGSLVFLKPQEEEKKYLLWASHISSQHLALLLKLNLRFGFSMSTSASSKGPLLSCLSSASWTHWLTPKESLEEETHNRFNSWMGHWWSSEAHMLASLRRFQKTMSLLGQNSSEAQSFFALFTWLWNGIFLRRRLYTL